MKKAVQFGGGNIGRGFTGQLFSESGFEMVFVDVVEELVTLLNERHSYPIRLASDEIVDITINDVRAVNGRDIPAVADEIRTAELMCTAVGVNVLPHVAPAIAAGIKARHDAGVEEEINIIICENMQNMAPFLKSEVKKHLDSSLYDYLDEKIGFVESVVGRMVPIMTEQQKMEDPLLVIVEPYKHLPVARSGIKGVLPEIVGVEQADKFQSYVDRKLYTHNAGHAVAAYLGFLKGYEYIYEAVGDSQIYETLLAALDETGKALIAKHDLDAKAHREHIEDLIHRFSNVALADQVARVGRDPIRKLGPEDRLVGGAKLALSYDVFPVNMCKAIAAGLHFDPPGDPTAKYIHEAIEKDGVMSALCQTTELAPESEIAKKVVEEYETVAKEFAR